MAVTLLLLSVLACSATRLNNLLSAIQPTKDEVARFADKTINPGFRCSSLDSCGDCFFSGCFWQPAAEKGKRCAEACMVTTASCYGTFAPYEIAPPNNVIHCPGGVSLSHSILRGEAVEKQHAADVNHAATTMLNAHLHHATVAAAAAKLSPAAARAHAAAAAKKVVGAAGAAIPVPSVHDAHGCSKAAGTSWCVSLNSCIAHFEEQCPHGAACSAHLNCNDCTKNKCFFSPSAHGQPKCQPMCLMENGNCYGTFSPAMIPPPHNNVACPALPTGPDAKCRSAMTCEDCFAHKCFWTPSAHVGYKCNSKCPLAGAVCFGTFDPHFIAYPHNVVQCPSAAIAAKKIAASKAFKCLGDNTKWAKNERAWCCTYKKKGCVNTVNCKDQSRMMNWSGPERRYCCATYQTACSPVKETLMVHPWPEVGLSRSKSGWFMEELGGWMQSDPHDLEAFVKFTPVLAKADYKIELAYPSSPTFSRATIIQVEAVEGRQVGVVDQTQAFYKMKNSTTQWHDVGVFHLDEHSTVVLSGTSHAKGPVVVSGIKFTPVKVADEVNVHLPNVKHNTVPTAPVNTTNVHAIPHAAPGTAAAAAAAAATAAAGGGFDNRHAPAALAVKKVLVCPADVPVSFELYDSATEPEFGKTPPKRVGCAASFAVKAVAGSEIASHTPFAIRYFATIMALHEGDYLFNLTSAGRATLHLDQERVLHDEMEATTIGDKSAATIVSLHPKYGKMHLKAGMHRLELQYFDKNHPGNPYLDVFFTGPKLSVNPLMGMVCTPQKCAARPAPAVELKETETVGQFARDKLAKERQAAADKVIARINNEPVDEVAAAGGHSATARTEAVRSAEALDNLNIGF